MRIFQFGVFALCTLVSLPSFADQVKTDDLIVQGNLCVGTDCVSGEVFSSGALKLKENNLRIRWYDTSAAAGATVRKVLPNGYFDGEVGQSWRMEANQSANGGLNAFYINQQSVNSYTVLSDGTAPDYDCSDPSVSPNPIIGTIPEGQPTESTFCAPVRQFLQIDSVVLGGTTGSGVALGAGAEFADGQVGLGTTELRRRLVHVAAAIADSDVLTKSQLDIGLFQEQSRLMDELEALLDSAEAEIAVLEAAVLSDTASNRSGRKGGIGGMDWFVLLLPLLALSLRFRKQK
ncbi:MAG: hypothetical protein CL581_12465 [Alteromonadaceae bacterium]|nr:hypothetical protein [Alteromonadaceae bacterium]MBH86235.1 hypothetical protein [Alteromonadaceae bacterium]|tara:strand:- start:403 stop:1272 length:870 start_codon:yes stop_codon:yes gene_type:complete